MLQVRTRKQSFDRNNFVALQILLGTKAIVKRPSIFDGEFTLGSEPLTQAKARLRNPQGAQSRMRTSILTTPWYGRRNVYARAKNRQDCLMSHEPSRENLHYCFRKTKNTW